MSDEFWAPLAPVTPPASLLTYSSGIAMGVLTDEWGIHDEWNYRSGSVRVFSICSAQAREVLNK